MFGGFIAGAIIGGGLAIPFAVGDGEILAAMLCGGLIGGMIAEQKKK